VERALAAYAALAEFGEAVGDEWTYVTALAGAGRARMTAAAGPDPGRPLDPVAATAVVAATAEIARITDPHRAIDWLSTFPAVIELALGGPPVAVPPMAPAARGPGRPGATPAAPGGSGTPGRPGGPSPAAGSR
jgi:hypothetical protein